MYNLMLTYPIRPGELRALSWKNVDFIKNEITICQHFSKGILIDGRKSIKKGKKQASIKFNMTKEAREIFLRHRTASVVSLNSFCFLSPQGIEVSEKTLWEAWAKARKIVGHTYAPYECRHAAASELYIKTGKDLLRTMEVGGWTSTATVELYARDRSDNSDLFQSHHSDFGHTL